MGGPTKKVKSLEGETDLAIGGEWATTLYDKVLPTQAKKIVKKKGAVGRTRLGSETAKNIHNAGSILLKERALKNEKKRWPDWSGR